MISMLLGGLEHRLCSESRLVNYEASHYDAADVL